MIGPASTAVVGPWLALLVACGGPEERPRGAARIAATDTAGATPVDRTPRLVVDTAVGDTTDSASTPVRWGADRAWLTIAEDVGDGSAIGFGNLYSPPGALRTEPSGRWRLVASSRDNTYVFDVPAGSAGGALSTSDAVAVLPSGNHGSWPFDEDGDGVADDVWTFDTTPSGSSTVTVWPAPVGEATPTVLTGFGPRSPCVADLTGDGIADLVGTDGLALLVYEGPLGAAEAPPRDVRFTPEYGRGVDAVYCPGDVTGDGHSDLWSHGSAPRLDLVVGPLDAPSPQAFATPWQHSTTRPLPYEGWNGRDGSVLLMFGPTLHVLDVPVGVPMNEADLRAQIPVFGWIGYGGHAVADLDRDGVDDLVFLASDRSRVGVYLGPLGEEGWTEADVDVFFGGEQEALQGLLVHDLDDDGWVDVGYSYSGGEREGAVVVFHGAEVFGGRAR